MADRVVAMMIILKNKIFEFIPIIIAIPPSNTTLKHWFHGCVSFSWYFLVVSVGLEYLNNATKVWVKNIERDLIYGSIDHPYRLKFRINFLIERWVTARTSNICY